MAKAQLENGVTLEYEIHGDATRPTVFVILGITDNITDWPQGLYQPLVDRGFCVVRYELRDSGLSTKFDAAGHPNLAAAKSSVQGGTLPDAPYTVHDMVKDAQLLMDNLNIQAACVVGYSYGSMVAQLLALAEPDRVKALVCLQGSNYSPALSQRTPEVEQAMFAATKDYTSREDKISSIKNLRLATNGTSMALDEAEALASATTSVDRMYYPAGTARIVLSRFATEPFFTQNADIGCPTLVLHGDQDPIFPLDHGQDMAQRIPDAKLVVLEGAGHNHPLALQPTIAQHIGDFAAEIF